MLPHVPVFPGLLLRVSSLPLWCQLSALIWRCCMLPLSPHQKTAFSWLPIVTWSHNSAWFTGKCFLYFFCSRITTSLPFCMESFMMSRSTPQNEILLSGKLSEQPDCMHKTASQICCSFMCLHFTRTNALSLFQLGINVFEKAKNTVVRSVFAPFCWDVDN